MSVYYINILYTRTVMMATDVPQILYVGLIGISNPTLLNLITTLPEGDRDCHVTASSLYLYMRLEIVILIFDY